MAKQTTVTITDDLDGSVNAREVTFGGSSNLTGHAGPSW
jgi:hypothetical protein